MVIVSLSSLLLSGVALQGASGQPIIKCDKSLWKHVYHLTRLQVVKPCIAVTGVIQSIKAEPDGDYHIQLKLDPQYASLINSVNQKYQKGYLVIEPICQNPVTQADAVDSCKNFKSNVKVPPIGTHVKIIGAYVLDNQHGGWAEIHPVTSIEVIR